MRPDLKPFIFGPRMDELRISYSATTRLNTSVPGFGWQKLRTETPGKYESYVDLIPGEWTNMKIFVTGDKAQLYVKNAAQPCLIVNDLKQPKSPGSVALWIGPGTIAHFANMKIMP